jgi:hypothetical protein
MCQKCDHFQAFVGASPKYLGERFAGFDARREVKNGKRTPHDAAPDYRSNYGTPHHFLRKEGL